MSWVITVSTEIMYSVLEMVTDLKRGVILSDLSVVSKEIAVKQTFF